MINNKIRKQIIDNLCLECMTLFVDAFNQTLNDKVYSYEWDEDQYTTHICGYLNKLKIHGQWYVSPQQPYYTKKHYQGEEHPSKAPRPDIHFEKYVFAKQKPFEFTIEAKNIKSNDSHLKCRYIDTGIENFKSKRYPHGCLAGYVVEGTADECTKAINSLLEKRNRNTEILSLKGFTENIYTTYVSEHASGDMKIELKHIFLEFYKN